MKADLHIHTTASDGEYSPTQVVELADSSMLDIIAVTDHDTVSGIEEAMHAANSKRISVIPGIEISARDAIQVHVLGYDIDYRNGELIDRLNTLTKERTKRNLEMISKLNNLGIDIEYESVTALAHGESVGRAHIARALVNSHVCNTVTEAFNMFLDEGKPAYSASQRITPAEAVKLIKRFGGISVVAHPMQIKLNRIQLEGYLRSLKRIGLDGLESYYFAHNLNDTRYYVMLAKKLGLLMTGGSDFHGDTMGDNHSVRLGNKYYEVSAYAQKVLIKDKY
ncbi:MAG: PHP domain-containing protein [Clostridia bacterium]|nr:PHP domain-containing protein [Clostridia bacterium]